MALSVHHEQAAAKLRQLASSTSAETFTSDFDAAFPGWDANAELMRGYVGEGHETTIKAAWSMQDSLPAPLCTRQFDWARSHGLVLVMAYSVGRTTEDLVRLLNAAAERLSKDE